MRYGQNSEKFPFSRGKPYLRILAYKQIKFSIRTRVNNANVLRHFICAIGFSYMKCDFGK